MNNVSLTGRLTKDCDLRYTSGGTAVATFTLAVNRNFTNKNGEKEADFIQCVIWRKPSENLANMTRKGSKIGVTGRIQTRHYDNQQGQRVYVTEILVEEFDLFESKEQTEQRDQKNRQANTNQGQPQQNNQQNQQQQGNPQGTNYQGMPSESDIPPVQY